MKTKNKTKSDWLLFGLNFQNRSFLSFWWSSLLEFDERSSNVTNHVSRLQIKTINKLIFNQLKPVGSITKRLISVKRHCSVISLGET
jgi:hypothetical protein